MKGHDRFLKAWQHVSLPGADHGPHEFGGGAGQRQIRLARDGRPLRVAGARPFMPLPVQVGEPVIRRVNPVRRQRAGPGMSM